jgi:hypothetical protein
MLKPISPTVHGAMDYATVVGTVAAPTLLKMPNRAAGLAYGIATAILGLAAFTDFKPGLKRAVPLKAHGITDSALGLALPAMPWMLGFAKNRKARNFFLGLTAMMALSTMLTDWTPEKRGRRRRRAAA